MPNAPTWRSRLRAGTLEMAPCSLAFSRTVRPTGVNAVAPVTVDSESCLTCRCETCTTHQSIRASRGTIGCEASSGQEWPPLPLQRTERLLPCNMHSIRCSKHVRALRACECCTAIWRGGRGGSPLFLCVHFAPPQLSSSASCPFAPLFLASTEISKDSPRTVPQHALSNAPLALKLWLDSRQLKRSKVAPFFFACRRLATRAMHRVGRSD